MKELPTVRLAVLSRLLCFGLQVLFHNLLDDFDSSTVVSADLAFPDKVVNFLFGGFDEWDSVYFLRIAKIGYEFEQFHAFFPGLPVLMRVVSNGLSPLTSMFLSRDSLFLISGVLITNTAFVLSALVFYRLSMSVLMEKKVAYQCFVLYCFNPASIFMTTIYTESLFALFTFCGMYLISKNLLVLSALPFCFACLTRSNGIINCGFLIHELLLRLCNKGINIRENFNDIAKFLLAIVITVLPFLSFQLFSYDLYCTDSYNSVYKNNPRPWCNKTLPFLYSFVQEHYWNNGFLRYYEIKQLPNFGLAAPILCIGLHSAYRYSEASPQTVRSLGLRQNNGEFKKGFFNPKVFSYILYTLFLTVYACLFMHIQVATRFLCSSTPVIYWYYSIASDRKKNMLEIYFCVYFCLGTLLHTTFYPWT